MKLRFFLLGCWCLLASPAPFCRTPCGLETVAGNCTELRRVEGLFVRAVAETVPLREDPNAMLRACKALRGWRIEPRELKPSDRVVCGQGWVLDGNTFCVIGYTHEGAQRVEVVGTEWGKNATAHELMHVVDLATLGQPGHCQWGQRGVHKALKAVTGTDDTTEGNCP